MANPILPIAKSNFDRKLLDDIARVGWAVVGIPEDDQGPGYAFSIGLFRSFGHPEIILFGLPWDLSYRFLNDVGAAVRDGKKFEIGPLYDELAAGFPWVFEPVPRGHYKEFLGTAGCSTGVGNSQSCSLSGQIESGYSRGDNLPTLKYGGFSQC